MSFLIRYHTVLPNQQFVQLLVLSGLGAKAISQPHQPPVALSPHCKIMIKTRPTFFPFLVPHASSAQI